MLRPLVIDEDARARAAKVRAYALAHPWSPEGSDGSSPGDDDNFVATFGTYRTVFSYTKVSGRLYRHLSISVPGGMFPNPAAAFALAELFGFTGWDRATIDRPPDDWLVAVKEEPTRNIELAQEMLQ